MQIVQLPASKSFLQRLFLLASFTEKSIKIKGYSPAVDVHECQTACNILGKPLRREGDGYFAKAGLANRKNAFIHINASATALRFILAKAAIMRDCQTVISMGTKLRERPHKVLVDALRTLGASINKTSKGFTVEGRQIWGGDLYLKADVSSQYLSALALIAPFFERGLVMKLGKQRVSTGYLLLTLELMRKFGVDYRITHEEISIFPGQRYRFPKEIAVEPDYSSACYFWALGALSEQGIGVYTYGDTSLQPDFFFVDILQEMGAEIVKKDDYLGVKKRELRGVKRDFSNMPDQVPTLAVLALFASSETVIENIGHLIYKESDRLNNLAQELRKTGADILVGKDWLKIKPTSSLKPALFNVHHDHRLAMAFAILQKFNSENALNNYTCVKKSFPDYFECLKKISL